MVLFFLLFKPGVNMFFPYLRKVFMKFYCFYYIFPDPLVIRLP